MTFGTSTTITTIPLPDPSIHMRDESVASSGVRGLNYTDTSSYSTTTNALRSNNDRSNNSTYASSMYSTSSSHTSSALDTLHQTRRMALDRLKGWRKSTASPKPTPQSAAALGAGPQITLQPLQCKANAREPLQQRDITDPRSLAYQANKYTVSDNASIIRRHRPDQRSRNQNDFNLASEDPFSDSCSLRPSSTRPSTAAASNTSTNKRLSVASNFSLKPTPAPPSATAQSIPCDSPRLRQSSFSERPATANIPHSPDLSTMTTLPRTYTTRSQRIRIPQNPVSCWDDDEDEEEPKKGLFNRFKSTRSFSSRKASISSTTESIQSAPAQSPSIKSVSPKNSKTLKPTKSVKSVKSVKTAKAAPKTKSSKKGSLGNKFGIDDLGDFEWNMHAYMEGDEEGSDAEIEAALRRVREAEANEAKETTPTPTSHTTTTTNTTTSTRVSTSHSTPTPESVSIPISVASSKVSPVLPPISPSQSLDLGLEPTATPTAVHNERIENENIKLNGSPNYAREHVANLLRRRANSGNQSPVPQTPVPQVVAPEQCPWDTWKYTSNHHTYQITPPDSTRSSHVYASDAAYDTSHHSMVLPESPVQLQPTSSTSSSSSDQTKWNDISANIALIQQQIQEMSPRSRELARGFAAKELTKPATLVTPTTISPATFATPPPRPSRDNVELPECFSKPFLTMTNSPSVRPLPRRLNKLGPALEESDASPDSSQRSSVSTRLSTAPSSPEPDMRCFI